MKLTKGQKYALKLMTRWQLPSTFTPTYAEHEILQALRAAERERVQRRQRVARSLAIALGWRAA